MTSESQWDEPQADTDRDTDAAEEQPLESSEADHAEQEADLVETPDWKRGALLDASREVSEADAVEQLQEVEIDEDEYR